MKFLLVIILIIFVFPTINLGGIPIRIEDAVFLIVLLFLPRLKNKFYKPLITILVLVVLSNTISFLIQIFSGYTPILSDLNTVFSLIRNVVIFCAGLKIGMKLKGTTSSLLLYLSIGFFISSIISIVQFYDIAGLGTRTFLLFGRESGIEYGINRAVGVAGNPNYAAFFQLCGLVSLLSIKYHFGKFKIIIYLLLSILTIWSVYVTFSRTGLLAMALMAITYLAYRKKIGISIMLGLLLIMILPFFNELISGTRYEQVLNGNSSELLTLNGRVNYIWTQKLSAFYENPVWGISSSKGINSNSLFGAAIFDNSFLYLLVTSGIVGTFITLLFYFKSFALIVNRKNKKLILYALLLYVNMIVFYLTTDLVKTVMFTSYYFMTMGLLISFTEKKHKNESSYINTNPKLE